MGVVQPQDRGVGLVGLSNAGAAVSASDGVDSAAVFSLGSGKAKNLSWNEVGAAGVNGGLVEVGELVTVDIA